MFRWHHPFRVWSQMSDVARLCLLTALGCFAVALLGAVVNLFIDNWFQSMGMAIVGLFYLVLFLANLPPRGIAAIGAADVLKPDYVEFRRRQRTTQYVEEPEEQCV